MQYSRLPCPSLCPGVCSNSCPLSWWCHPAISSSVVPFSSCPQSLPASGYFPNESKLHMRWPKYWSFSFSISPSNEQPGLISFKMDWFDLLWVQGMLKSLVQYHSSKAAILQCSAFFMVQLSHPSFFSQVFLMITVMYYLQRRLGDLKSICYRALKLRKKSFSFKESIMKF